MSTTIAAKNLICDVPDIPGQNRMAKYIPPEAAELRKALGRLRDATEISQGETAHRLAISQHRLTKYEAGKREPPLWLIVRIADYYKVSTDFLLKGQGSASSGGPVDSGQKISDIPGAWMWETDKDNKFTKSTGVLNVDTIEGKSRQEIAKYPTIPWHELDKIIARHDPIEGVCYTLITGGLIKVCKIYGKPAYDGDNNFTGYRGYGIVLSGKELADYQRFVAQTQKDNLRR